MNAILRALHGCTTTLMCTLTKQARKQEDESNKNKKGPKIYKQTKVSLDCPGIILKLSRNCPDTFLTFSGSFGYVFPFSHTQRRQHINKFAPHSFAGQSRKVVYVLLSFCPRTLIWAELKRGGAKRTEKQNLVSMARWRPFLETLCQLFLRKPPEGNSRNL